MTLFLTCESISKSHGSIQLFENVSFSLCKGDKIGLIGPNGSGKSTLLKILAGLEKPDNGQIAAKRSLKIGYVPQESNFPDLAIEEYLFQILKADHSLHDFEKQTAVSIMLGKLGFENPQQSAATLSGGWKKRLEIAKALLTNPDVVLFDEPTNHLDLEGILWLEGFLQGTQITYIIISHDRYFLENTTNRIFELNKVYPGGIFSADGTYSYFLEKREEFLQGQEQYKRSLNSKVRREVEWLRQSPKARTTKAQSRVDEANRLIQELSEIKARTKTAKTQVDFEWTERESRKLIVATNIGKSFGDRQLFAGVNLTLSPGTRVGIVGMNGSGKSTLLKILAGQMAPDRGTVKYADALRLVYFDQHRDQLPLNVTLRRALAPENDMVNYRGSSIHVNSWCKRFLFHPDRLDLPISQLSGGERARIMIARLMVQPADVLFLDEPTNDLDIPTLETLEESLTDFPGAIVMITHDRYMIDQICNKVLGLGTGSDSQLFADYSQWDDFRNQQKQLIKDKSQKEKALPAPLKEPAPKKLSYHEKREFEQMEEKILEAEELVAKCQKSVDDPAISHDSAKLQEACEALHAAQEKLDKLFHRWEELENKNK